MAVLMFALTILAGVVLAWRVQRSPVPLARGTTDAEATMGWIRCPNPEPHDPHEYTIIADRITVAGGRCDGQGRNAANSPETQKAPED